MKCEVCGKEGEGAYLAPRDKGDVWLCVDHCKAVLDFIEGLKPPVRRAYDGYWVTVDDSEHFVSTELANRLHDFMKEG